MKPENPNVSIKIRDTGIGISEEQIEHIFDRFYQVDDSMTRQKDGSGIGLALTYELVKLMNGEIKVKSKSRFMEQNLLWSCQFVPKRFNLIH